MKLLKFEAPWCTKCTQMTNILETMDLPFPVVKVNIDSDRDTAMTYGIRGLPHMILMDENDNIVTRIGGVATKEQIAEAFGLNESNT